METVGFNVRNLKFLTSFRKEIGCIGARHFHILLLMLCITVSYVMRVNLGLAILLMTNTCNSDRSTVLELNIMQQSLASSSFFWGYMFTNIMTAFFITKFNIKMILLLSVIFSSCITGLLPLLVRWGGFPMLIILRVLTGLVQGVLFPVALNQISRWIPPTERTSCCAFVLTGMYAGTIISYSTSGYIGEQLGWECIYFVHGIISLIWCPIWLYYGAESPQNCHYISYDEKQLIKTSLVYTSQKQITKMPWKLIVTNRAFYGILIQSLSNSWTYWSLSTEMPTYLTNVFNYDPSKLGFVTSMPIACLCVLSVPVAFVGEVLIKKGIISVTFCRKIICNIALLPGTLALIILGYTTDAAVAIGMYTTGQVLLQFTTMGLYANHLDITPNFAARLHGFTNGLATSASIMGPQSVGFIINNYKDKQQWSYYFYLSGGIFCVGTVAYIILGSGTVQPFNDYEGNENRKIQIISPKNITKISGGQNENSGQGGSSIITAL